MININQLIEQEFAIYFFIELTRAKKSKNQKKGASGLSPAQGKCRRRTPYNKNNKKQKQKKKKIAKQNIYYMHILGKTKKNKK